MVRFGIIGTNFITDRFIAGGKLCEGFAVRAVYSRTMEKAREFAAKYGVEQVYDRLEDLAESGEIDAVYIASPNYCHADQAAQMLRAGKHVLVEKPATANNREWEELCRIARNIRQFGKICISWEPSAGRRSPIASILPAMINSKTGLSRTLSGLNFVMGP